MISASEIQMQKYGQLCFIDFANAFDDEGHKEPLKPLSNHEIFWKDVIIIQKQTGITLPAYV